MGLSRVVVGESRCKERGTLDERCKCMDKRFIEYIQYIYTFHMVIRVSRTRRFLIATEGDIHFRPEINGI